MSTSSKAKVTGLKKAKTIPGPVKSFPKKKAARGNKPSRKRRERKGRSYEKREIMRKEKKAFRLDPRNSAHTVTMSDNQVMSNVLPAHQFTVSITADSLVGAMVGAVSAALSRGWQTYETSDSNPYWALVYGVNTLLAYATNTSPKLTQVPKWLNILGQFLTNKTVPSRGGKITYRFQPSTTDVSTLGWEIPMGPSAYSRNWNIGVASTTAINTHFYLIQAPGGYTADAGERAFNSLVQFLQTESKVNEDMHESVSATHVDHYTYDCSAYAVNVRNPGGGFNFCGGLSYLAQNEIPIRSPIMSVFKPASNEGGDSTRFQAFTRSFAGDPIYAGAALASIINAPEITSKRSPLLHFIDFNEVLEVLAYWCQGIVSQATEDESFLAGVASNSEIGHLGCPLTFQELQLILRSTLMNLFKDTQHAVQGIYPKVPANSSDKEFCPFISGFGTCAYPGTTAMYLPIGLVENLRSLTMRLGTGYIDGKNKPQRWVPVLGCYVNDTFDPTDFDVNYNDGTTNHTITMFLSPETYLGQKTTSVKGKEKVSVPLAEVPINIIDGRTAGGFVAINDPAGITKLTNIWNAWVKKMGSYSQELTTIGTEGGINILELISSTRYWTESAFTEEYVEDPRLKKNKALGASPFAARKVIACSFNVPPLQAVWETVQQRMIMPIIHVDAQGDLGSATGFQRIAAAEQESNLLSLTSSTANMSLTDLHYQFAYSMVKTKYSRTTEDEDFYKNMATQGRGGILSSLASAFSKPVGEMAGGLIAQGISMAGNALPF